ncbi:homoserine kinase [Candidatus Karelsulcia muelleri]|uniref:homoserine kinase n=1 Tax=Candidatus Karelsulcia muelleri TaxID=336810 RepID=UPI000B9288D3|nr:homoserine kinase [Candidatus Karelsulcia muelleri]ASS46910.1 Homoserine kinase [Candidatus Karelsulcia muelleri]
MNIIKVIAPATIANIVCGFDVLGLAVNIPNDEIIIKITDIPGIRIQKIFGANLSKNIKKNVISIALQALLNKIKKSNIGFDIEISKNIQPGSGIGSSAASAAGIVVGANYLLGNTFKKKDLIKFAMEGERLAGGVPHADNVAPAIIGGITLIRSYKPLDIISLRSPDKIWVSILHPEIEIKTSDAREILKHKILITEAIKQWGNLGALIAGLYKEDYDMISRSLDDVIIEPIRAILIPAFNELKIKCKSIGALGGGISGSGPSVFMLSNGKKKAELVTNVMEHIYSKLELNYKIYTSSINRTGIVYYELI